MMLPIPIFPWRPRFGAFSCLGSRRHPIIVDPMKASVPGDTSAQFAPSPDNKQKLSRAGNWAPDRLVTVESSPRSKHRKKRGRMQCVRQSDEVEVPAMIARFWDGTASYGHVPRALACTVQAGFAPKQ